MRIVAATGDTLHLVESSHPSTRSTTPATTPPWAGGASTPPLAKLGWLPPRTGYDACSRLTHPVPATDPEGDRLTSAVERHATEAAAIELLKDKLSATETTEPIDYCTRCGRDAICRAAPAAATTGTRRDTAHRYGLADWCV